MLPNDIYNRCVKGFDDGDAKKALLSTGAGLGGTYGRLCRPNATINPATCFVAIIRWASTLTTFICF